MLILTNLETAADINSLLTPKRDILTLANKVNGSMLAFHREVASSIEIEELANTFFETKQYITKLRQESSMVNYNNLPNRINKLKNIKIDSTDFI
jgi:hypothetical protein